MTFFLPADGVEGAGVSGAASSSTIGTNRIPQIGQSPGRSETIVGCMGQWYLAILALAAALPPPGRSVSHQALAAIPAAASTRTARTTPRVFIANLRQDVERGSGFLAS